MLNVFFFNNNNNTKVLKQCLQKGGSLFSAYSGTKVVKSGTEWYGTENPSTLDLEVVIRTQCVYSSTNIESTHHDHNGFII